MQQLYLEPAVLLMILLDSFLFFSFTLRRLFSPPELLKNSIGERGKVEGISSCCYFQGLMGKTLSNREVLGTSFSPGLPPCPEEGMSPHCVGPGRGLLLWGSN